MVEIRDILSLKQALTFVANNFKETEKKVYTPQELDKAYNSLLGYDVFDVLELEKMVKSGQVKVFASYVNAELVATSALEVKTGKILFFARNKSKDGLVREYELLETMVEERATASDRRLNYLAFLGQEQDLKKLGFIRINPSVFVFFGIKFIALKYDYAQLDIER